MTIEKKTEKIKSDIIDKVTSSDVVKIILLPLLHHWSKWQMEPIPLKVPVLLPPPDHFK